MDTTLTPGQTIECTLSKPLPRDSRRYKTVQRLMRLDPDNQRALRDAQEHRRKTLVVRTRGGRPWPMRPKAAKVVVPAEGASWRMKVTPQITADVESVSDVLDIKTV